MMKIESIIQRPQGTKVTLQGTTYHFKPEGNRPEHVASVENPEHIQKFLAVPDGFRVAPVQDPAPAQPVADAAPTLTPPSHLAAAQAPTPAAAQPAPAPATITETAPAAPQPPAAPAEAPAQELADAAPAQPADPTAPSDSGLTEEKVRAMNEDELRAAYKVLNGRAAPGNAKFETVLNGVLGLIASTKT